jgi:F-type H+-transporting ATPase subunit c
VAKFSKWASLGMLLLLVLAAPALAQPTPGSFPIINFDKFLGAGLTIIGAAFGIGRLASSALESMARQPEVAGSIQTAMIIAAALIEGATLFALVICFLG